MSHPTDANCIFCKIVAGQIPSFKLLEDDKTIAFMDINPVNPGHSLSVAKGHWPMVDTIPTDVLGAVAATAQKVAKAVMSELKPNGVNLLQANGPGAGQSVPHLHIHIMPRRPERRRGAQLGIQARRQGRDRGDLQAAESGSVVSGPRASRPAHGLLGARHSVALLSVWSHSS